VSGDINAVLAGGSYCYRPRFRLFFSVDLVGSTALKQKNQIPIANVEVGDSLPVGGYAPDWMDHIASFYKNFESSLRDEFALWADRFERSGDAIREKQLLPKEFVFWKSIGDELLYYVELSNQDQAWVAADIWLSALKSFAKASSKRRQRVKSAIFSAGFPFMNSEIVFAHGSVERPDREDPILDNRYLVDLWGAGERDKLTMDFIGPSIDTGFRISQHATPRKVALSVDVAYLLARGLFDRDAYEIDNLPKNNGLDLYFSNYENLKGVFDGRPYPIFWLNSGVDERFFEIERGILKAEALSKDTVKSYCEAYYQEIEGFHFKPFILNSRSMTADLPKFYKGKILSWEQERKRAIEAFMDKQKSLEKDAIGGEAPVVVEDEVEAVLKALLGEPRE
jgi:hypothetical protein